MRASCVCASRVPHACVPHVCLMYVVLLPRAQVVDSQCRYRDFPAGSFEAVYSHDRLLLLREPDRGEVLRRWVRG